MIIVHTINGIITIVQMDDGSVSIYRQEDNILLAKGEFAEIAYRQITCTVKGEAVW